VSRCRDEVGSGGRDLGCEVRGARVALPHSFVDVDERTKRGNQIVSARRPAAGKRKRRASFVEGG